MDEFTGLDNVPELVQQMIRRGTIHDDEGVRCVNNLPDDRRLQDVLAAR
jgi:polyhydroxyalkanoate synthesis regulator phasin